MLGIPNPYAIGGVALLSVLALGGSYWLGRTDGQHIEQAAELKAEQAAQKQKDEDQALIDQSAGQHQAAENQRQSTVRDIYHDKETIVERPVYTNVCVDADGVRLLQKAANNANGAGQSGPSNSSAAAPVSTAK